MIGGIAVSILSKPRTTKDIDVIAWLPDHEMWSVFLASGKRFGITPRIPNAFEFAMHSRVLLLRHDISGVPIDVSMGALPFEEIAIKRAKQVTVGDFQIPVPTPEDLIVLKAIAHRPRDLADIESVLKAHTSIDEKWIRATVQEFANLLDAPEIFDDLEKLLDARTKKTPRRISKGRKR
ncbi:MAG TPA: nucleotidyl transferase AbiEii/AbiGii toxin family protein [Polyangium sp.]|nr:nucleotidyl transferase AbiEii/AbiGii toxin family protein [Polyangium sp.]